MSVRVMDTIWNFIEKQFAENQLFSGGLILMIAGGLIAYFRDIPSTCWSWIKSRFVYEVDILDREQAFDWLDQWLAQHRYATHRARWLTVRTRAVEYKDRQEDPLGDHRPRIMFTPAPGTHMLFFRGRLVILHRIRPEANQATQQPVNTRESFSLTIFTRDRNIVLALLQEAREVAMPQGDSRLTVYRNQCMSWGEQLQRCPRSADSVVLPTGVMENLIADSRRFLENRNWYLERGIPYRRGYLLYGPPGTGKSSTVVAIASALKMDIAILNLAGSSLDDSELAEILCELPVNALLLIEDIDCVFVQREATEDKHNKVTFSGLLNALDGVAAGEGRLLFATTNHRERLDAALIRPGRIDRQLEIGYANRDQIGRMFLRFFPSADPALVEYFASTMPDCRLTMSAVQTLLIEHAHSPEDACAALDDWLAEQGHAGWQQPGPLLANPLLSDQAGSTKNLSLPKTPFCVGL
ncbi:AAA family ATPase [Anatilimnocola sp. NA78]|uniref:AAA family ATPase n=1 Tax=Anatilimnocola sp. NA78 TaxID=3415683 RepID=UPI003CE533B3